MKKHVLGIVIVVFLCLILLIPSLADQIVLPSGTTVIEDEAFLGDRSLTELVLPEGLLRIGSKAFTGTSLSSVVLPRSLQYFAQDAFDFGAEGFEVYVYEGTDAARLCADYGIQPKIVDGSKVGISMPTIDLQRWCQDGMYLQYVLETDNYEVDLRYASNDIATQLTQIEAMIDDGCEVIVIAPIEGSALGRALNKAADKGVKVIAYDRLLMDNENVDYYAAFDNYRVGALQGDYVRDALDLDVAAGSFYVEFTAGDPGDNNARSFYNGAMDVLRPYIQRGKLIVKSGQINFSDVATPTWRTEVAQARAEGILASFYADGTELDAWLCSNDSTALGVINALDSSYAGKWPVITGQDCDRTNVSNIIAGKQAMSVFKDTRTLAAQTATMVRQIMNGETVDVNDTVTYNNNSKIVPTYLCDPVFCDANNYRELLIDSGFYTEDDIGGIPPVPTPALADAVIHISDSVTAGRNCTFSFSAVENATSYEAFFDSGEEVIVFWDSTSALPDTNMTIPGYWLDNGNYSITVAALADGYRESMSTRTFTVEGGGRPAPAVEVNRTSVQVRETFTFTINTENANDLRYRIGNNNSTNHINVFEDETEFTSSWYNAGDFEYSFTVRRGNTWSEWTEPIVIHVAEETMSTAPTISILSPVEEGKDLVVSISPVDGADGYGFNMAGDNQSIYTRFNLRSDEIDSIVIPGYSFVSGTYSLSAYSYSGNEYSDTTYRTITIAEADRPDAPEVRAPENTTVAPNNYVYFTINTTGADQIAIRHYQPGNTNAVSYDDRAVANGQAETTWEIYTFSNNTRKYSFSVRKNGVWSFWSSPITITVDENGSGTSPQGDGIKIGIINPEPAESDYREANVRSLHNTFTVQNGYAASFVNASMPDQQMEAAQGFIDEGVDYLAICASEAYGWDGILQEAKDAGISVFLFDRMINCSPSLYTAAVVTDYAEEAKTAVEWLESLNLSEYRVLHIKGQVGSSAQLGRSGALEAKCNSDSKWTMVRQGTGGDNWDPNKARQIVQTAINAGEDFNVIYAENDGMAGGAVEALDAAGITHGVGKQVIIMSFDCNKWALRKLLAGEWNYDGQCSPFQAPYIDSMIKTLEAGRTITGLNNLNQFFTPEIGFDARTITQADVDTYGLGE